MPSHPDGTLQTGHRTGNFSASCDLMSVHQNPTVPCDESVVCKSPALLGKTNGSCEEAGTETLSGLWPVPKVFQSCREGNSDRRCP